MAKLKKAMALPRCTAAVQRGAKLWMTSQPDDDPDPVIIVTDTEGLPDRVRRSPDLARLAEYLADHIRYAAALCKEDVQPKKPVHRAYDPPADHVEGASTP